MLKCLLILLSMLAALQYLEASERCKNEVKKRFEPQMIELEEIGMSDTDQYNELFHEQLAMLKECEYLNEDDNESTIVSSK